MDSEQELKMLAELSGFNCGKIQGIFWLIKKGRPGVDFNFFNTSEKAREWLITRVT